MRLDGAWQDLALVRPQPDFCRAAHPAADDVWLLVEVAETPADADRDVKVSLYARAGIREVWLVDLAGERVEVSRAPSPARYRDVRAFGRTGPLRRLAEATQAETRELRKLTEANHGDMQAGFTQVRAEMAGGFEEMRRHFKVVSVPKAQAKR